MRTYESTMTEIAEIEAEQRAILGKSEPSADDKDHLLKAEGAVDLLRRIATELHDAEVAELRHAFTETVPPPVNDARAAWNEFRDYLRAMKAGQEIEIRSWASNTGSGSYLVPQEWHDRVMEYRFERNFLRSAGAQVITTESTHNIPVLTTLSTPTIVGENTAYTASDPTVGQVILYAYKLADKVAVSEELLSDAAYDVAGALARAMGLGFGAAEEAYFLTGTGSSQPTGIFNKTADKTLASTSVPTTDELVEIAYGLARHYRDGAMWMMDDSIALVIAKLKEAVTTSGTTPYWWPQAQQGANPVLLGYPVMTNSNIADAAAGAKIICFGNPQFYLIGERGPMNVKRLVLTEYGDTFAFHQRIDGKCLDTSAFYVVALHA